MGQPTGSTSPVSLPMPRHVLSPLATCCLRRCSLAAAPLALGRSRAPPRHSLLRYKDPLVLLSSSFSSLT
jgi:hypothetical protein